jgi:hypothetical protein
VQPLHTFARRRDTLEEGVVGFGHTLDADQLHSAVCRFALPLLQGLILGFQAQMQILLSVSERSVHVQRGEDDSYLLFVPAVSRRSWCWGRHWHHWNPHLDKGDIHPANHQHRGRIQVCKRAIHRTVHARLRKHYFRECFHHPFVPLEYTLDTKCAQRIFRWV